MPRHEVHEVLGELCGISRSLMKELNVFIDSVRDHIFHDANRVIRAAHWNPEALLYIASIVYRKWGKMGLKAFLHHHLLDYTETLISKGRYGAIFKYAIEDIRRSGFVRLAKNIKTGDLRSLMGLLDPRSYGLIDLREDEFTEQFSIILYGRFVAKVLENIVTDFSFLIKSIESHGYERILGMWRPKHPKELKRLLMEEATIKISQSLIETSKELKRCIQSTIHKFIQLKLAESLSS